jgi:hypothetical protein
MEPEVLPVERKLVGEGDWPYFCRQTGPSINGWFYHRLLRSWSGGKGAYLRPHPPLVEEEAPSSKHSVVVKLNTNMVVRPNKIWNQELLCWWGPGSNYCSALSPTLVDSWWPSTGVSEHKLEGIQILSVYVPTTEYPSTRHAAPSCRIITVVHSKEKWWGFQQIHAIFKAADLLPILA